MALYQKNGHGVFYLNNVIPIVSDLRVGFLNSSLHVLMKCQSCSNKINLVIMMATKIRSLGHRRTVSCYESEIQHMAAAIVSEHGAN